MFNNKKEYLYSEVPREVYESLKKADSVGSELNKTIKGKFKFTALE